MTRIAIALVFSLLVSLYCKSQQTDTIWTYNFREGNFSKINPVTYDTSIVSDHTGFDFGSVPGKAVLDTLPPTTNLYKDAQFSRLAKASSFFNVNEFPARATVKLYSYVNGELNFSGSGIMVGPDLVLTFLCCRKNANDWSLDSMLVVPAMDNGMPSTQFTSSVVGKYHMLPGNVQGLGPDNLDLLQTWEPIGLKTGWIGVGFQRDNSWFDTHVLHEFSYPASYSYKDSSIYYNGDTMYYNYGLTQAYDRSMSIPSNEVAGINGQNGSSLFYTNGEVYYSLGVLVYANQAMHYRIQEKVFYAFKNIIENSKPLGLSSVQEEPTGKVYPNPFSNHLQINFENPNSTPAIVQLINITGQVVVEESVNRSSVNLNTEFLQPGVYCYRVISNGKSLMSGKVIKK